jgi:hypothetical protein
MRVEERREEERRGEERRRREEEKARISQPCALVGRYLGYGSGR